MQSELNAEATPRPIRILGINEIGQESGNAAMTAGRMLPWLQDTADAGVWRQWAVTFRDVVILDAQNRRVTVYGLTQHDLANAENYAALKNLLIDAASRVE